MNVNMEIDTEDARFLYDQLVRHAEAMQIELAHTEQHDLQHALVRDLERMRRITGELDGVLKRTH
ncbi:MAG TPA: hypothetical protein VM686_35630 [Polyangiaceae bacterium]|nr:hypothetical protein [Polyangiaceae bacterium]